MKSFIDTGEEMKHDWKIGEHFIYSDPTGKSRVLRVAEFHTRPSDRIRMVSIVVIENNTIIDWHLEWLNDDDIRYVTDNDVFLFHLES